MQLPAEILKIIEKINAAGKEAFLVGGAVRDSIMGITPFDFDITTSATPEELTEIFKNKRVIPTGIKHGTVTVIYDKLPTEITTYRIDLGYSDGRHPDGVKFSGDVLDDLARRDFTVNAICYHPKTGYLDPFSGREDIKAGVIRTVGAAKRRFSEDALRIMRGIRFAATLGFSLSEETEREAFLLKDSLTLVSRERITVELKKLLGGKAAYPVLNKYYEILRAAIPLGEKILPDFSPIKNLKGADLSLLFAAFFISVENSPKAPLLSEKTLTYLKSDNALKNKVALLTQGFFGEIPTNKTELKLALTRLEPDALEGIITLSLAFDKIDREEKNRLLGLIKEIIENKEPYRISHLDINGRDLLRLGIKEKEIGKSLNSLLLAVITGECQNTKAALIENLR